MTRIPKETTQHKKTTWRVRGGGARGRILEHNHPFMYPAQKTNTGVPASNEMMVLQSINLEPFISIVTQEPTFMLPEIFYIGPEWNHKLKLGYGACIGG